MDDSHRPNTTSPSNNQINDGEKMEIPNEEAVAAVSSLAKYNSAGNSVKFQDKEGVADNKIWPITNSAEDVNRESVKEDHSGADTTKSTFLPFTSSWENKPDVWFPPEPEDIEDDREGSVSNIDDDDDYGDGTKWGQPSPLSSPHEDQRISHSLKEERSKAMVEAMNGQFKFLVSRFLASEGIVLPKEEEVDKGWLDIVASLSWEAALFIKPEANEGRAMDPASYVKVKCIACGSPKQSEVIKGLVFKKNIAHKHMSTKFKNPRLLLLKGVLGEGAAGLSSFNTMNQEKGFLKSVIDMIETCHPNVVLVEKNASRDVQESLLAKGIALVFDMKLQRLERIARCTGSPIISYADIGMNTNLRQCDYFHIERLVEELNQTSEGGKKTSKSLMFFEGCPKPLGCTILLKGAHSDELKKVKRVMHYTIFAAYHLILETSFFADQRAISLEMCNSEEQSYCTTKLLPSVARYDTTSPNNLNPDVSNGVAMVDIPVSAGSSEKYDLEGSKLGSGRETEGCKIETSSNVVEDIYVPNNTHYAYVSTLFPGQWFPFPSVSLLRKVVEARINQVDMDTGLYRESPPLGTVDAETEVMKNSDELVAHDDVHDNVKIESVSGLNESLEHVADANNTSEIVQKDDIDTVLDPQSILVLFSSRSILKDTACEQSHLTRIKYYGNFDMSLGRFLQDILLSKSHSCAGCGQAPTSHIYSYTHQNGKLTVQVKSLSERRRLTGEAEGKIWMWTRCLKCQLESGIPRSTKRVVMSTAARGLSFGKFLELSFSSHSAARRLSRCGHLLHRDCLRFFGLGSKVAMFRYSPVEIYAACKPPPSIEINSPVGQEWFEKETKDVLRRGKKFFSDVASKLQKIGTQFTKETVNLPGASRDLSDVEAMLMQEKLEFEASLTMSTTSKELSSQSTPEIFDLTHLSLELLLALYVWDCRLLSLSSHAKDADSIIGSTGDKQLTTDAGVPMDGKPEGYTVQEDQKLADTTAQLGIEESSGPNPGASSDKQEMSSTAPLVDDGGDSCNSAMVSTAEITDEDIAKGDVTDGHESEFITTAPHIDSNTSVGTLLDGSPDSSPVQVDESHVSEHSGHVESTTEIGGFAKDQDSEGTVNIVIEGPEDWIWSPFTDIRKEFWKDYSEGHLHKFDFIYNYIPKFLTPLNEVVAEGREKLCYPVGVDGIVISIRDEEISSIIACASVLFQDKYISQDEKDAAKNKAELEDLQNLEIDDSTSFWSSGGSMNIERLQSSQSFSSVSSDEFSSLNSEGSLFVDRLLSSENLHPEIHLGSDKTTGKSLYSVVCIYAKQFYTLRRQCCPSELAYISSMSRCKMWDAQGGKSKALFAKTLDDRFIIKEIKKTELASFLKFAQEYFKHVSLSLSSGSQTCLAKILGVYQVRQVKGGKEVKTDLMVMENLLFGRNISRTYDLKGAVFSRYIADSNNPGAVLLDQNFIEDMCLSPMYVGGRTKHLLQRAIWNDTSFLTSINVMDYSLLVGVDKERRELVFGIIDYLRQYTWDKQLETWVKTSWVVPKNSQPTIISPKEYKKRFRKFMAKYFLTVPDSWSTQRSDSCKILTDDNDGSSHGRCTDSHENAPQPPNGVLVAKV